MKIFASILVMMVSAVAFAFLNFQTKAEAEIQNQRIEDFRSDLKSLGEQLNKKLDWIVEHRR